GEFPLVFDRPGEGDLAVFDSTADVRETGWGSPVRPATRPSHQLRTGASSTFSSGNFGPFEGNSHLRGRPGPRLNIKIELLAGIRGWTPGRIANLWRLRGRVSRSETPARVAHYTEISLSAESWPGRIGPADGHQCGGKEREGSVERKE